MVSKANTTATPLVSVIVPVYNYADFIGQTLESVRAQTYGHWECWVVDDDSTDATPQVVARYAARDGRIRYLHQKNARQAAAKNTGLRDCAGEYIQFLDADDLIEPEKFAKQVEFLEREPDVDIVYGGVQYFRTENTAERLYSMTEDNLPWMPQVSGAGGEVLEALVRDNIMVINSPLVRRGVVEEVGPFDAELPPAEDWDYWLRCALAGARFQFADIEGTLALVRMHPASSSQDRWRMYRAGLLIRQKLAAAIKDEQIHELNRRLRAKDEGEFGIMEASRGNSWRAARHLFNSARFERRWKWKIKLSACALAAPFVSDVRLRSLIASSVVGSLKGLGRKPA